MTVRLCKLCSQPIAKPRKRTQFCSTTCRSRYFWNHDPRRPPLKQYFCEVCRTPILYQRRFCIQHSPIFKTKLHPELLTKTEWKDHVRRSALKDFTTSSLPKQCLVCGYDKHVNLCHIKPIRQFPVGTPKEIVNASSNLTILCPNHHWEFDHGLLDHWKVVTTEGL